MNFRFKIAAAAILAVSVVASYGQSSTTKSHVKKHTASKKAETSPAPTVEEQIQALRQELEGQIDSLKSNLAEKNAQLQQAQQAAADAQATAAKAEADANAQQQAATENSAAVTTLQSNVNDLKGTQTSLATTISDETSTIKKAIASPDTIHYKGITISPAGSFIAGETVNRTAATGGGLNTAFTGVPLQYAGAAQMSEFQGTGRQSRLAIKAVGKLPYMSMTGYYEIGWAPASLPTITRATATFFASANCGRMRN
jgi:Tfp pilus assembly protein FimV